MAIKSRCYSVLIWAFYFLLSGCATIVAPTGGDKDIVAPKIVQRSLADSSLQFKGGKWHIDFDEFIKLQDLAKELTITPLVKNNPTVSVHKRRLTINMPDSLLDVNTTYRVDFGKAVRDLREGNPYDGLAWTFSTGSYFDSLSIHGQCLNAATGFPDTSMSIFLYPAEMPDSLLWVNKPLYTTKNKAAGFEWKNLPNRDFKLVALQDENNNFKRDTPADRIAFIGNTINPTRDTGFIQMYSFSEASAASTKSKTALGTRFEQKKPTQLVYVLNVDTTNINQRSFNLYDSLKITFSRKPGILNLSAVRLYTDSVLEAEAQCLPTGDSTIYIIRFDWQENTLYQLRFLPEFANDTNGTALAPHSYRFRSKQASDYGLIRVRNTIQPKHIIQLILNDKIVLTRSCNDSTIIFSRLLPGQYALRRHIDENNNGVWDTGSWADRRQPERVERLNEQILIKGNWENAIDIRKINP